MRTRQLLCCLGALAAAAGAIPAAAPPTLSNRMLDDSDYHKLEQTVRELAIAQGTITAEKGSVMYDEPNEIWYTKDGKSNIPGVDGEAPLLTKGWELEFVEIASQQKSSREWKDRVDTLLTEYVVSQEWAGKGRKLAFDYEGRKLGKERMRLSIIDETDADEDTPGKVLKQTLLDVKLSNAIRLCLRTGKLAKAIEKYAAKELKLSESDAEEYKWALTKNEQWGHKGESMIVGLNIGKSGKMSMENIPSVKEDDVKDIYKDAGWET